MMYTPPVMNHQAPQKLETQATNGNNSNGYHNGTNNDMLSYRERFQNNFNKFTTPHTKSSPPRNDNSNLNSHLDNLFDKAQGITPHTPTRAENGVVADDKSTCSKYLIDPKSALKDQTPGNFKDVANRPERTPVDVPDGGSISRRAVPATPDFLVKSNPLYTRQRYNSHDLTLESKPPSKTPDVETNGQGINPKMADMSISRPRRSLDRSGQRSDSASEDGGPCRPSFEQTRRHWVYTPRIVHAPEEPKAERKLHPGARSRPLPEYLNFRKYSVPLVSPRPRVEVKQQASDDQMPEKKPEMRSLQKSSSEVDSSSVHQLLREGDDLSYHDENSIRYIGRTNPSKVFQLLQSATGAEADHLVAKPPPRRRNKKTEPEEQTDADDIVDISYVGGNIPSRTFQCLKEAFDDKDSKDPFSSTEFLDSEPARAVKVIHLRPRKSIDNGIAAL